MVTWTEVCTAVTTDVCIVACPGDCTAVSTGVCAVVSAVESGTDTVRGHRGLCGRLRRCPHDRGHRLSVRGVRAVVSAADGAAVGAAVRAAVSAGVRTTVRATVCTVVCTGVRATVSTGLCISVAMGAGAFGESVPTLIRSEIVELSVADTAGVNRIRTRQQRITPPETARPTRRLVASLFVAFMAELRSTSVAIPGRVGILGRVRTGSLCRPSGDRKKRAASNTIPGHRAPHRSRHSDLILLLI